MIQTNAMKIVFGIALSIAGMLAIFIGFVAALIAANNDWLWLSVIGLGSIVGGSVLVRSEVQRIVRTVKRVTPHIKSRLK